LSDGTSEKTITDLFRKMLLQLRESNHQFRIVIVCDALDEAREIAHFSSIDEEKPDNFVTRFSSFFDEIRQDLDFCGCALICSTALDNCLNFSRDLKVANFELESKESFLHFTSSNDFLLILKFFFENRLNIPKVPELWLSCVVEIMLGEGLGHQKDFRIITWLAWLVLNSLCQAVDRFEKFQNLGHKCKSCGADLIFDSAEYMRDESRMFQSIDGSFFCHQHVSELKTFVPYIPPRSKLSFAIEYARKAYLRLKTSDMTSVLITYMIQGCISQLIGSARKAVSLEGKKVSVAVEEWKKTVEHATDCLATVAFIGCNEIDADVILHGKQSRTVLLKVWEHFVKDQTEQNGIRSGQFQTQMLDSDSSSCSAYADDCLDGSSLSVDPAVLDLLWRRATSKETKAFEESLRRVQTQVEEEFSIENQSVFEKMETARLKKKLFDACRKKHNPFDNVWGFIANCCKIAHNHMFLVDTAKTFLLSKLNLQHENDRRATIILEYAIRGQAPVCSSLMLIRSPITNFTEPIDIFPLGSTATHCSHWFMSNTCRCKTLQISVNLSNAHADCSLWMNNGKVTKACDQLASTKLKMIYTNTLKTQYSTNKKLM
jgi:hypothetical protein